MVEQLSVDLNRHLIARIRSNIRYGWCRGGRGDNMVHITFTDGAVPFCGQMGRQQRVDLKKIKQPELCGACHHSLVQRGLLSSDAPRSRN